MVGLVRRPRERALLAVLLCARAPVHREQLIDVLWPHLDAEPALTALQSSVYRLRRALAPCDGAIAVDGDGDVYRLVLAAPGCCDALELLTGARSAIAGRSRRELERLAEISAAPFLPEWPYADWARVLRAEVEETRREVIEALAARLDAAGDLAGAAGQYRRLVALEPEREGWHRALMRLYARMGERATALRQYQILAGILRTELGIEPCAETRELHRVLLVEDRSRTLRAVP
jgi:DNA-binding SARP family transcriptional activator